jgi:anti-anti-sigma regulatory factor
VYAPQVQPALAPVSLRLIGVLDAELVVSFAAAVREFPGATVLVDVRDVGPLGESEMRALTAAVAAARAAGCDVRLDARSLPWRRAVKRELAAQPAIEPALHEGVKRTVILAHSGKRKRA